MGHQQLYWSHPRKFGQGSRSCRVCSNRHGLIRKYGLNMCRQCFRQYAKDIGFVKSVITKQRLKSDAQYNCRNHSQHHFYIHENWWS
ncbi:small ribosomal subunit protein uS14 [Pelodytes ibericus]